MYSRVARHVLLPLHDRLIKRRNTSKYRHFLEDSQWWSRDRVLAFQWEEAKKLLTHAYDQAPYWKEVFGQRGLTPDSFRSPADLKLLPIVDKADIRRHKREMITQDHVGKTWTKATGGSTGEPLELDYTPDSYDWRVAISRRGYGWAGCEEGMRQVWIWGVPIGERPWYRQVKEHLHERVLGHIVFNSFKFDERTMARCLETIRRYRPSTIVGYTNPLHNFARYVTDHGGLGYRPQSIISAAERLFEYQRTDIENAFQSRVYNTYGSREFMLIAAECGQGKGLHVSVENLLVEIVKDDGNLARDGEAGEVVITDLHNYGMPFIRYRIGDMAIASEQACECGRGLPLLRDINGRVLDIIRTHDGRQVPGEFFPHLMKEFRGVRQFQVVQPDIGHLMIRIVKAEEFTGADEVAIRREIDKIFEGSIAVELRFVDRIPLTKTGKYRVTISHVPVR